jgi:hypothetical protein
MTTGLPIVAVPTTYAGSEATDVWGLAEAGGKPTGVDPRVLPSRPRSTPFLTTVRWAGCCEPSDALRTAPHICTSWSGSRATECW